MLEPYKPFGQSNLVGNVVTSASAVTMDNWKGVALSTVENSEIQLNIPLEVHPRLGVEPTDEAYIKVLESAGASMARDAVDL